MDVSQVCLYIITPFIVLPHDHLANNLMKIDAMKNVIVDDLHQFWGRFLDFIVNCGLVACLLLSISHPWSTLSVFCVTIVVFTKRHNDYWKRMMELFKDGFDLAKEEIQNIGVIQALEKLWIVNQLGLVFS